MKSAYSNLIQSRFFNPAFNSAIFDGPVRIYFSQFHESLALKIYFSLQQMTDMMATAKELHRTTGRNVLIMLYPSTDSFQMSFDGQGGFLARDVLDGDQLIGINGPFEDDQLPEVLSAVTDSVSSWTPKTALEASFV